MFARFVYHLDLFLFFLYTESIHRRSIFSEFEGLALRGKVPMPLQRDMHFGTAFGTSFSPPPLLALLLGATHGKKGDHETWEMEITKIHSDHF